MEMLREDLEVQVFAFDHSAPNQVMSLLNEDVTIATEVVTEKPEVVEIERESVIKKHFIVKEKKLIPKKTVTFPSEYHLEGRLILLSDWNFSQIEVSNQDSEEFSKMEIASQESVDSRMEISSQESSLSQMECSSQEADILIKPISDDCAQSKGKGDIRVETCKVKSCKGNSISINNAEVLSTGESHSEECLRPPTDAKIGENSVSKEAEDFLEENLCQGEIFETNLKSQSVLKRKADIVTDVRKLRSENSLLSREKAVAAREAACIVREKAIQEREAALANQEATFFMAAANDSPFPKRLKSVGGFECSN